MLLLEDNHSLNLWTCALYHYDEKLKKVWDQRQINSSLYTYSKITQISIHGNKKHVHPLNFIQKCHLGNVIRSSVFCVSYQVIIGWFLDMGCSNSHIWYWSHRLSLVTKAPTCVLLWDDQRFHHISLKADIHKSYNVKGFKKSQQQHLSFKANISLTLQSNSPLGDKAPSLVWCCLWSGNAELVTQLHVLP